VRAHEAERDHFLVVAIDETLPERIHRTHRLGFGQHRLRLARRRGGNVLVAVQARHLLDEVFLDREIESERWRSADEVVAVALWIEGEPLEDALDLLRGDRDAEKPRDARGAHANRIAARQFAPDVDQRTGDATA